MKTYMLIILLLLNLNITAQELELVGSPGIFGGIVNALEVSSFNPSIIYVARNTILLKSEDGGVTLNPVYSGVYPYSINDLVLVDEQTIILCVYASGYIISNDGGQNWSLLHPDTALTTKIIKVNPSNPNVFYIKKNTTELWRSNNKGGSWYKVSTFDREISNIEIHPMDTSVVFVATDIQLYKSNNSGVTWESKLSLNGVNEICVNPLDTNVVYIKTGVRLYKSIDGGISMTEIFRPGVTTFKLNKNDTSVIYLSADSRLDSMGILMQYGIYKSTNGGLNWERKMNDIDSLVIDNASRLITINPVNSDEVYINVSSKGIYKSTNAAENWELTNLSLAPVNNLVMDKDNANFLITSNWHWGILKTNDGGKKWFSPNFDVDPLKIEPIPRNFDFNPENKLAGFLANENGLYKTTDGGDNWQRLPNFDIPTYSVYYHKFYPDTLFLNASLSNYASYDGGNNWIQYESGYPSPYMQFVKTNSTLVYSIENLGNAYKSYDLGKTWVDKSSGLIKEHDTGNYEPISSLVPDINNPDIVYCGQWSGMSKTTNGGDSWFRIDSSLIKLNPYLNHPQILLDPNNPERIYVGSAGYTDPFTYERTLGGLYLSENDCKSWRKVYDNDQIVSGIFTDDGNPRYIYVNTNYGLIRFLDTLTVTDIKTESEEVISRFQLFQNYPNPFNPRTVINYSIKEKGIVKLRVFDILGRLVATLVNEEKSIGNYTLNFDGSNLANGVYIYQIQVNGFVSSKKMMLLK